MSVGGHCVARSKLPGTVGFMSEPSLPQEPLDEWSFDEDFINSAKARELSGEERAAQAARIRAGHERMKAEGSVFEPTPSKKRGLRRSSAASSDSWSPSRRIMGIPAWALYVTAVVLVGGMFLLALSSFAG